MSGIRSIDEAAGRLGAARGAGAALVVRASRNFAAERALETKRDISAQSTGFESASSRAADEGATDAAAREIARLRTLAELKTLVRAIRSGVTDPWQLTDLIFYARHPELIGVPLTGENAAHLDEWNDISALLVHPTINEVGDYLGADIAHGELRGAEIERAFERAETSRPRADRAEGSGRRADLTGTGVETVGGSRAFDDVIARAVEWCPGLSPAILKSLLAQESGFNPTVINKYGYAGIAQFGREAAREVGLQVGVAGTRTDERLDPHKAIPAAARLLRLKAQRLSDVAFSRYGQPDGAEFWKFVLAAYNGGEGTVALAMGHAYRRGLAAARGRGLVGGEAVSFARSFASKWENLRAGGAESPLGQAAARYFPALAAAKFREIGDYPAAIVGRALKTRA